MFKPYSVFYESFYAALQPYVHFIPVQEQLHDLFEQIEWARAHPQSIQKIHENSEKLSWQHLRKESVVCYIWRVLSGYAKLQNFEPPTDGMQQL